MDDRPLDDFDTRLWHHFELVVNAWLDRQAAAVKAQNVGNARHIMVDAYADPNFGVTFRARIPSSEISGLIAELVGAYKETRREGPDRHWIT